MHEAVFASLPVGPVFHAASLRFVEQVATQGGHVRAYRVACNGNVHGSAAPGDEVLVARLLALEGEGLRKPGHYGFHHRPPG